MDKTPNFLKEGEPEQMRDALKELNLAVEHFKNLEASIAEKEEELKQLKAVFNNVSGEEIPGILLQNGLSQVRLDTGEKVSIKEDVSVTIVHPLKFFEFLKQRDEDDIVKLTFQFPARMEQEDVNELFEFLDERGYDYKVERDVHAQTRKKYFRDLFGLGLEPAEKEAGLVNGELKRPTDVEEFAKTFTYWKTTIK